MKPRIKLCPLANGRVWRCEGYPGELSFGRTPKEAYWTWKETIPF